jgi:NADH-quinone oxidoreductase subunit G
LPIAPFTETSGTFVNCEGRVQSFNGVVRPLGETRPGWKVLRVLGNALKQSGFDFDSSEQVLAASIGSDPSARLANRAPDSTELPVPVGGLERLADVPMHFVDPLVRRAPSLQQTRIASAPVAGMHPTTIAQLGLSGAQRIRAAHGGGAVTIALSADERVAPGVLRVAQGHPSTAGLGPADATLTVEPSV